MKKPKVTLVMACWGRPAVFKIVLSNLEKMLMHPAVEADIVFVVSREDRSYKSLVKAISASCLKYEIVQASNDQLGDKHNKGVLAALKHNPDYIMNIGSDDLIHYTIWDLYLPYMVEKYHLIGMRNLCFYESPDNAVSFTYSMVYNMVIGAGRLIKASCISEIIDQHGCFYSPEINRGLDTNSQYKLSMMGISPIILESGDLPMIVDIKTKENLNSMQRILETKHTNKIQKIEAFQILHVYPELKKLHRYDAN